MCIAIFNCHHMRIGNAIITLLRIVLPLGLIVLVVFFIYKDLDVDGKRVVTHTPLDQHVLVTGPEPEIRLANSGLLSASQYWSVIIDPVYFKIILPYAYTAVDVTVEYQAPGVPLVQLGGLSDAKGWNFTWQGMQNDLFEAIEWPCIHDQERNWWLCQEQESYASIDEFLLSPPRGAQILNYNFSLPEQFDRLSVSGYNTEIDYQDFDYLIADYQMPTTQGEWSSQTLSYDIQELDTEQNTVQFALSAPGLDDRGQAVQVRAITFTLHKEPLTFSLFMQKAGRFFTKLVQD